MYEYRCYGCQKSVCDPPEAEVSGSRESAELNLGAVSPAPSTANL